jgi:preprotein translocase subunit SecE
MQVFALVAVEIRSIVIIIFFYAVDYLLKRKIVA